MNSSDVNPYLVLHSPQRVMWGHEITLVAAFHFPLLFVSIFLLLSSSSPPTLSHYLSSHPHYCSAYLPMQSCHKVHHKKTMSARLDCASAHISHIPCFVFFSVSCSNTCFSCPPSLPPPQYNSSCVIKQKDTVCIHQHAMSMIFL